MSAYQFHYLNQQHALSCLVVMTCPSDDSAKEKAMRLPSISHRALEIWRGETLVYDSTRAVN